MPVPTSLTGLCERRHCALQSVKTSRPRETPPNLARLGPSVRALLRTEEKVSTGSAPTTTKNEAPSLIRIDPEEECSLLLRAFFTRRRAEQAEKSKQDGDGQDCWGACTPGSNDFQPVS